MKKDERTAEPETASASEGKLRSFLRLIKNDKSKSDVQVPVKGKANKKATDKKEKRSVRTAAGKEKPKKSFFSKHNKVFSKCMGRIKKGTLARSKSAYCLQCSGRCSCHHSCISYMDC